MSDLIERTKEIAFSVNDRVVSARILEAVNGLEAQQAEIAELKTALAESDSKNEATQHEWHKCEDEIARLRDDLAKLDDPQAVHVSILRGAIAKPSIAQIIHIYGADTLRKALEQKP